MLNNFSFNDAYRLIANVIDERIRALTRSGAGVEITWGTVASLDGAETCSVYIDGNEVPSGGFRLENGLRPNVLDPVRVNIDKRGNRWVDSILTDATLAHPKLEIKPREGVINIGDGTSPATSIKSIIIADKPASATTDTYPVGVSTFMGGLSGGWPADFVMVTTVKQVEARIFQIVHTHANTKAWMRFGHSSSFGVNGWGVFTPITPETVALAQLAVTGTITADRLILENQTDASMTSTSHALQIGPTTGLNIIFDGNEILSRNNGANDQLVLNADGGEVNVNANAGTGGLRIMRGGIKLGTTAAPPDDLSMLFGADVLLQRSAANVLTLGAGDRFESDPVAREVRKTTTQAITSGAWNKLTGYGTTAHDGGAVGTPTWNPYAGSEMRANVQGIYLVYGTATFAGNVNGASRIIGLTFNNAATPAAAAIPAEWERHGGGWNMSSGNLYIHFITLRRMLVNDTMALAAYQSTGANLNINNATLGMVYMGND